MVGCVAPTSEQFSIVEELLKTNYRAFTLDEMRLAFKMNITGEFGDVIEQSSYFSHEGYSEYYNRLKLREEGKIKPEDVYGYEQALAHIEEMRKSVYDGKLHHAESIFEIRIETTVVSKIFMPPKKQ